MIQSMIIATTVTSLIGSVSNSLPIIFDNLTCYTKKIYRYFFDKAENKVNVMSTIFKNSYGVKMGLSPQYKAIMNKIIKNKKNLCNICYLENNHAGYASSSNTDNSFKKFGFYVDSNIKILLDNHIYVSFNQYDEMTKSNDNESYSVKYLTIVLSSKLYTTPDLQEIINKWTNEFLIESKVYKDDGNLYHYSLGFNINKDDNNSKDKNKMDYNMGPAVSSEKKWSKNKMISFKTFDNVFFNNKEVLLKKLDYFLNNEEKYKIKGIPYNIGFLFYGNPGCGKTSCIKAISNYTNRHVVEINLKQIDTCGDFIDIFYNEMMDDDCIPHNKKIIVLEDIDCMIDIIKSRENENNENLDLQEKKTDFDSILSLLLDKSEKKFKRDDKLTLSCILNTIDGILENYGRILIITTNYIDRLDKALIRPGRIDMKVNFTNATNKMCRDIIENFFEQELSSDIVFPDYKYTPAEVLEICSLYQDDIDIAIKKIIT
jgi:hypothetical protein